VPGNGIGENIMPFEENEISKNSQGGTESVKRELAKRLPTGLADNFQIICSRVRELENDKIRVYWLHDLPEDPETNHLKDENSRNKFHKLVFCGHWQYNRYKDYLGIPPSKNHAVIDTPIDPFPSDVMDQKDPETINLIYTSTPQRGLELLVPVFEELAKKHKDIHLHVFSSFKIYGWDEADKRFEPLYDKIRNHPQMTYHGFKPNEVVREYVAKADIFAYPSVWLECNSRSLIEAMSAGALCVHPNIGGLTDTSGNLTYMYQVDNDINLHAAIFMQTLDSAINLIRTSDDIKGYLRFVKAYADTRFNWDKISSQWIDVLTKLNEEYNEVDSRRIPAEKFIYST
jgi:UDP-glucose:(glucosyl)LPS alpha-1,2-glucosyltransferase